MDHQSLVMKASRPWLLAIGALALQAGLLGLSVLGWGDWRSYFSNPARAGACVVVLVATAAAMGSGMSWTPGRREDVHNRWIFVPLALGTLLLVWLLPFADRHDLLTIDEDAIRYVGLGLLVAGSVLRIWPMFVLGRRFSPFVAIQERHDLVTEGIYGVVRHPSYLGAVLGAAGWVLIFRSGVGLLLVALGLVVLVARIEAEERLLASEFGAQYAAYRDRTWRLIPFVY